MKAKKILLTIFAAILAATVTSCSSGESADAGDLISTVPSDASVVAVANMHALLEKSGCKVSGDDIEPSPQVLKLLQNKKDNMGGFATLFYNGESGIAPTVGVMFRVGYYTYISGIANDPAKFKAAVEKEFGSKFNTEDGVETAGNIALIGNQFWVNVDQKQVDAREVKHFSTLDESQSFMSNPQAESLCKFDKDVVGWLNIAGFMNTAKLGFEERAIAQTAIQTVFEDAANLTFNVSFLDNGVCESEVRIIDSKGKPAKALLPMGKIDLATAEKAGSTANVLIAADIPAKLVSKLTEVTGSGAPSVFGTIMKSFACIDGTAAVVTDNRGNNISGVFTTTGKDMGALSSFLSSIDCTTTIDGNLLKFSKNGANVAGSASVADLAAELKDASLGVAAMDLKEFADEGFKSVIFTLTSESGSYVARVRMKAVNDKQNFLLTAIEK